jgi:hypothetical protein
MAPAAQILVIRNWFTQSNRGDPTRNLLRTLATRSIPPRQLASVAPRSDHQRNARARLSLGLPEGGLGLTRVPQSSPCNHDRRYNEAKPISELAARAWRGEAYSLICTHDARRSILCQRWFGRQSDDYMAFLLGWLFLSGTITRQRLFCLTGLAFSRTCLMNSKYVPHGSRRRDRPGCP